MLLEQVRLLRHCQVAQSGSAVAELALCIVGLRHFPEDDDISDETEHASQMAAHAKRTKQGNFQYKSSKECYEEFPTLVRSSTLLHPSQTFQPAELDLEAGPLSGHRQRPNAVDLEDKKRPRIPGEAHSQDILLREVITRRMQC